MYAGAAVMIVAELVNLAVHLQLRGMRPAVRPPLRTTGANSRTRTRGHPFVSGWRPLLRPSRA